MHIDSAPGITIGFEQTLYTVREDIGSLEVCTAIRNGTLQSSVVVTLTTVDGTAVGTSLCVLFLSFVLAIN